MFESAYKLDSLSLVVYSEYSGKFYAPQLSDFASLEEGRLYRRQSISNLARGNLIDLIDSYLREIDRFGWNGGNGNWELEDKARISPVSRKGISEEGRFPLIELYFDLINRNILRYFVNVIPQIKYKSCINFAISIAFDKNLFLSLFFIEMIL